MNGRIKNLTVKVICCSFLYFLFNLNVRAQYVPNSLTYQAVARDSKGVELSKTHLLVHISILANDENGLVEWKEEHDVTTNDFGLFTLNIGAGVKIGGTATGLNTVKWGSSAHFLKVEIDFGNGQMIPIGGATQMLAVPYALYAEKSGNAAIDLTGLNFDSGSNTLKYNGSQVADLSPLKQNLIFDQTNYHLSISGMAGVVDLRQFIHAPQDLRIANNKIWLTGTTDSTIVDLLPYKQSLSVNASSKLEISNGNSVQVDTSNVNEIQGLNLISNSLQITSNPAIKSADLSKYLDNTDAQTLFVNSSSKLEISNGNSVKIDTSNVNEIQDLTLTGNTLKINKNIIASPIDLSKYLDDTDTDKQTLARSGSNLAISGGNQVDVSDMINLSWAGFNGNNLSGQSLPGSAETLINWSEEFDSGNVLDNNKFVAPANGYYNLSFTLIVSSANNIIIKVYKNNSIIRTFDSFGLSISHTMLLNLTLGENISIKVTNSSTFPFMVFSGYFSGYRVN